MSLALLITPRRHRHHRADPHGHHRQRYRQALVGALYPLILTLYLLILLLDLLQSLFNGHWSSPLSWHKRKIAACSDTEISPLALHPIGPVDRHPITATFHHLQHHRRHGGCCDRPARRHRPREPMPYWPSPKRHRASVITNDFIYLAPPATVALPHELNA